MRCGNGRRLGDDAVNLQSPEQLVKLTGKMRYGAQRRVLDALGVPYRVRPDGSLVVFLHDETTQEKPAPPKVRLPPPRPALAGPKREMSPAWQRPSPAPPVPADHGPPP